MFRHALLDALHRRAWGVDRLGAASGLTGDRVESLVDGSGAPVTLAELEALAGALGPGLGPALVRAWLWDQCPPAYRSQVGLAARRFGPWRRGQWLALGLALLVAAAALLAVAQYFRYVPLPGKPAVILDRWTGETKPAL